MSEAHPAHHKPHVHETAPLHDPVDPWHDHTKDEKPQQAHAEVGNATRIMAVGIGLFLIIVVSVLVTYGFYVQQATQKLNEMEIVRVPTDASVPLPPPLATRADKGATLMMMNTPGWVEIPAAGDVPARSVPRIPIDDAKKAVAQDYAR